jgi:hypothetical protein
MSQTCQSRLLLLVVDRAEEGPTLGGEHGLRVLGIAKLAAPVRVAARLDDVPGGEDRVETALGVRGQLAAEGPELTDHVIAALVRGVLEDRELLIAVQLHVAVVRLR